MERILATMDRTYALDELPPHPSWCVRAGEPREACASGPAGGPFHSAEHESIDLDCDEPNVYLHRYDHAGFGIGRVMVGYAAGGDELAWTPAQARAIARELLRSADNAEAAANAA